MTLKSEFVGSGQVKREFPKLMRHMYGKDFIVLFSDHTSGVTVWVSENEKNSVNELGKYRSNFNTNINPDHWVEISGSVTISQ